MFRLVDAKCVPHTIDRFASYYNAQLPRFNSKFASPGCSSVNAMVQDWSIEINWVCPPARVVVDAVRVLTACSGRRTLIIPERPSAYFWPLLREGPSRFKSFVRMFFVLPAIKDLIWRAQVRGRSISLTSPFFTVVQNSECWLRVWILGEFLVMSRIVF